MVYSKWGSGDIEGNWTYTGAKGESIIDYVLVEEEGRAEIERMEVEDMIDSDHHPLIVWMRKEGRNRDSKGKKGEKTYRGVWNEEEREAFKSRLGRVEEGEGGIQREIEEQGERIRGVLKWMEEEREGSRRGDVGWWDGECVEKKSKVRKALREWKRKGEGGEEYRRERREYIRELCEEKKREKNEEWERKPRKVRMEGQVWEVVNREKRKRRKVNGEIKMGEWEEYFRRMLGGVDNRVVC